MNAEQLADTTMDPDKDSFKGYHGGSRQADEIFTILLGDK